MFDENICTNRRTSYLYHFQPIGIGTPYVESITSYIKRLAEAHYVSPGNLLRKEIIPEINKSYISANHFMGYNAKNINTLSSDVTKAIVRTLEAKTCNESLDYLTMSVWGDFFNPEYMFRKNQAWCPICYEENLQMGQPIYEQLIWSFDDVEICKKHKVRLIQKCPHCDRELSGLNSLSRVGYCDYCKTWLGLKRYENSQIIDDEWQNWVFDNVGQLLTTAPMLKDASNLCFSRNITNTISTNNLSIRGFANIMHVAHKTIMGWISMGKPSLNNVLFISYKLRCSVYDILTKDIDITNIDFYCEKIIGNKKSSREKTDKYELKKTIDEAIATNKVLSLKKLSTQYRINDKTIKKYFPEEVAKLKAISDEYFENCKFAKLKLIKDTMRLLSQRGIFPSRKALSRELGKRTVTNDEERKVWLKTLEELGCTIEDYYNSSRK